MNLRFGMMALLLSATAAIAQESCTSIMVGRKASADGSVITSHTCDSWYRTWVNIPAAQDFERDTVTTIYDGLMHTEFPSDRTGGSR